MPIRSLVLVSILAIGVSGCGTHLPAFDLDDPKGAYKTPELTKSVASHIDCELANAIDYITQNKDYEWLRSWSALVTLTMTVEEKSSLNPGATLTEYFPGYVKNFRNGTSTKGDQTFSAALGAGAAADATHVLKTEWLIDFRALPRTPIPGILRSCESDPSNPIAGDLGIYEAINASTRVADIPGEVFNGFAVGGPMQVISDEITFDLSFTGSATPTWKFAQVSGNASGTFLSGTRDRKDNVIIAMGPTAIQDTKRELVGVPVSKATKGKRTDRTAVAARITTPSLPVLFSTLASQIQQGMPSRIQQ